tara:strand:+ start:6736 stop:8433 length:1698 start_codon:yes stop_codon:yes gene_type:complete
MSIILGLNISGFHSSAAIISNGSIKAAITEERLSRIKSDKSFPKKAILNCCKIAGISISEISDIYIGWNPAYYLFNSNGNLQDSFNDRGKLIYSSVKEISSLLDDPKIKIQQEIQALGTNFKIHYVDHHLAHLSNSFLQSKFPKSDFLVADGFGETKSGIVGTINMDSINTISSFRTPHSLGSFYSTFTQFLGFNPNEDEWKVMALASLGDPKKEYKKIKNLICVNELNFELDLSFFEHFLFFTKNYFSPKFIETFGTPLKDNKLNQYHYNLVASVQKVVEESCFEILNNLQKLTKSNKLVLSGGAFMNSVMNGKLIENTNYEEVYIGGSPDDSGISTGSALYGCVYDKKGKININSKNQNYFGNEYSDQDIMDELNKRKINFKKIENIESYTAKLINQNKILAWFQGRSEFGQRALGNRSILANPKAVNIKEKVNSSIKYRESFRPFAPSIIKESQNDYLIILNDQNSYFMERVFTFKKEFWEKLPGVVHYNGTGRLQTVSIETNPKFYNLIREFEKLSGFPIILNTSFNVNGMPLVETPGDALDCFYMSGIDYLVLNNFIVSK